MENANLSHVVCNKAQLKHYLDIYEAQRPMYLHRASALAL